MIGTARTLYRNARALRSRRVIVRRASATLIAAGSALGVVGCGGGPGYSEAELARITRLSVAVPELGVLAERRLSYLLSGDPRGVRVIYIHGTPGSATDLAHFVLDPVPGTESVAVDRLGFGESDPRAVASFAAQARAIASLLEDRGAGRTILVGHSLGGPIAARLAADYPERVGGLVIVSGSLDPSLEKPRWFNHAAALPVVNPLLARPWRNSNVELMAAPAQTRELDRVLERVSAPTVVIHGERDSLVPVGNASYMRRKLSHLELIEIRRLPGEGHFVPWSRPDVIRAAVEELVGREVRRAEREGVGSERSGR